MTVRYRVKPRSRAGLHLEILFDDKQYTADVLCTIENQTFIELTVVIHFIIRCHKFYDITKT